jgi:2-oxoacid:acceptor oxidoreductase delta subunit (pyruvate/2-ketoisovalerate family)
MAEIRKHKLRTSVSDYPTGTVAPSGYLISGSSGWRSERPVFDEKLCRGCRRCYLLCPDASIEKDGKKIKVDLRFCKGCGICSVECKFGAIVMETEKR